MSAPVISVVMSVYNEENYVAASIESILNQTFNDFEFVIINDGSTDKTQEILERYIQQDERIRLIVNQSNLGLATSMNKGLTVAKGRYIAMMDAADISHAERLEKQVKFLEANSNVSLLGSWVYWIDENKRIIGKWDRAVRVNSILLYETGGLLHPSVMARKELYEVLGFYDTHHYYSPDFDLHARALKNHFSIANIPEFLLSSMRRDSGIQIRELRKSKINQFKIKLKYLPYFFCIPNIFYTVRSLIGCLLPTIFLRKLAERWYTYGSSD